MSENEVITPDATVTPTPEPVAAPVSAEVTAEPAKKSIDMELLEVWDKHQQPRKPDGRYDRKTADDKVAAAVKAKAAPQQKLADQPKVVQPDAQAKPATTALPYSWSAEKKARLASLPPQYRDVVEYAAQRDKEANAYISRAGETVKQYQEYAKGHETLDKVLNHYSSDFTRRGVSPVQAVATLLDAQSKLDANPRDGLIQIAATYGIDLRPAFAGQQAQQQDNPLILQLHERLQEATARIDAYEQRMTQQQQQSAQQQLSEMQSDIEKFSSDKPFFEEVRPVMAALLRAGRAKGLDDAYDMAMHAVPETRQSIQVDQQKAFEAKRAADAREKSEAARKAAAVNVRSSPAATQKRTMDDDLMEIARRHYQ